MQLISDDFNFRSFQPELEYLCVIRMLKEFVAKTKGPDVAEDVSAQQLMELMMNEYCLLLS